jgi:hypothetical protein
VKKIVMSLAVVTDEHPDDGVRAAALATRLLRSWGLGPDDVVLLSARWERDDDPIGSGFIGRVSG